MAGPSDLLADRYALVTGASRGIGAATARALDAAGARVALVARGQAGLERTAADMAHAPILVTADLADPAGPERVAAEVLAQFPSVDILVNNAALAVRLPTVELDPATIDELLAVNVRAPLLLVAAFLPSMIARRQGAIINVSSLSGVVGTPNRSAYAATKGAIDAATRSMAAELGPSGIRVNSVAPGVVDTEMWAKNKAIPGVVESIEAQTALRRWATPEDIADVIVFLASDGARFVTGETISADGGLARTMDLYRGPV